MNKPTIKLNIEVQAGSHFQHQIITGMLESFAIVATNIERKHKDNKVTITLEGAYKGYCVLCAGEDGEHNKVAGKTYKGKKCPNA